MDYISVTTDEAGWQTDQGTGMWNGSWQGGQTKLWRSQAEHG